MKHIARTIIGLAACGLLLQLAGCKNKPETSAEPGSTQETAFHSEGTKAPAAEEGSNDAAKADDDVADGGVVPSVPLNRVLQVDVKSEKQYETPLVEVEFDVIVTRPDGTEIRLPGYWDGPGLWRFRYASDQVGTHSWRGESTDAENEDLNTASGTIEIGEGTSENPLYVHGQLRVADDGRHIEHVDGTPFFWLGDTWWKCLCKRLPFENYQTLVEDRAEKGFTVVQIVCGPYPDENTWEDRWENEGGKPYLTQTFTEVNPEYFEYSDQRLGYLVQNGIVPAIVGSWGRGDCDGLAMTGVPGMKRHWRNLIARYGAWPTIWIVGGESGGPEWTEIAHYVREIDPYDRPTMVHPFSSGRTSVTDETCVNCDMLQTGHGGWPASYGAVPKFLEAYARQPAMPVIIGEYSYEQHMQEGWPDQQRYVFWTTQLSGSAGHTYGAAGVWHASVEGDPGLHNVYDRTTWDRGMNMEGSTQLGLAKEFLTSYPWYRFEPHPEWTEEGSFAAGIPGEVRFIYMPKRGIYNWEGAKVRDLEPDVPYHVFYFDPITGERIDRGVVINGGTSSGEFPGHTEEIVFEDNFDAGEPGSWTDHGTATERAEGHMVAYKDMISTTGEFAEANCMVSVTANSDAEAGIVVRYHDNDNYVVGLYSPLINAIYFHERRGGDYIAALGQVAVPEIGPEFELTVAIEGNAAVLHATDGQHSYRTPVVHIEDTEPGPVGLWMLRIGEAQHYDNFRVSRSTFDELKHSAAQEGPVQMLSDGNYDASRAPSPQDWVLVLERVGWREENATDE